MKVAAQLKSYEDVEFSIRLVAPVSDWRKMLEALQKLKNDYGHFEWPVGGLVGCIDKMLSDLDKTHADAVLKEDQAQSAVSN